MKNSKTGTVLIYNCRGQKFAKLPQILAMLRIRMRRAEQLLQETSLTLDDIALRVGLRTGAQLGAAFRAAYGVSPGQYRKDKQSNT